MRNYVDFETLVGKTFNAVKVEDDKITFEAVEGDVYMMYHDQDCCETVYIEDICGDVDDLVGSQVMLATERSSDEAPVSEYDESYTWTFYNIATIKGHVTIRWYGTSNGYYSESVTLYRVN